VTDVQKEGMKQLFIDYKEIKRIIGQGVDCCESSPQRNLPLKRNEKSTILPKIMVKSVLYFKYSTKRSVIFRFIMYLCHVLVKMSNPLVTSL